MKQHTYKPFVMAVAITSACCVIAIATLWSWNTLAELLGGPQAQFKHIAAAAIILAVLRWTVTVRPLRYRQRRTIAASASD